MRFLFVGPFEEESILSTARNIGRLEGESREKNKKNITQETLKKNIFNLYLSKSLFNFLSILLLQS